MDKSEQIRILNALTEHIEDGTTADADVDVAFTFLIYHLEGDVRRSDMTWNELPLTAGEFGSDTIHGVFYGSNE